MAATMKAPRLRTRRSLPQPRQARSRKRRQDLLDAARALFSAKGYEATAVAEITARARAAAGAFYIYFPSKRELLVELMNDLLRRLEAVDLRPGGTGLARLLTRVFQADLAYFGVIRAWQEAALTDVELEGMNAAIEVWSAARIRGVLQALARGPGVRPRRDLTAFARLLDRHFWSLLARGSRLPPAALGRELRFAAEVIERYLYCDRR
jgi:AcrR family transcriptional regulator